MDLRANDLCEGLAQLAIKEFVVVEGSGTDSWAPGNKRGLDFVDEAQQFVEHMPQQFGVAQTPTFNLGSNGPARAVRSVAPSEAAASPAPSMLSSAPSPLSPGALGTASFGKEAPPLSEALKFLRAFFRRCGGCPVTDAMSPCSYARAGAFRLQVLQRLRLLVCDAVVPYLSPY